MARDGTQSRTARPVGSVGPVVTLLVALVAVLAVARRKRHVLDVAEGAAIVPAAPAVSLPSLPALPAGNVRRGWRLPRFVSGTLTGIMTGIALGVLAAVLFTAWNPEMRAAVIIGAGLKAPPPTSDGEYVARVLAQTMNPTLAYADDAGVAALLKQTAVEPEETVAAMTPVEADLRDNAPLVFAVLGLLTLVSWGAIMWGLSGGSPAGVEAVVE